MLIYILVSGTIIAPIVFKVKEDIVVKFSVVSSVAIIIILGLVIGVAIIIIIILRRFLRACLLISFFSLAKRVFTSFAL
jgi:hypothetical protein